MTPGEGVTNSLPDAAFGVFSPCGKRSCNQDSAICTPFASATMTIKRIKGRRILGGPLLRLLVGILIVLTSAAVVSLNSEKEK